MLLLFGMVDIETVLVLGAGASKAFGFPTGEELVEDIYSMVDTERGKHKELFWNVINKYYSGRLDNNFIKVLRDANPLSIDSWLENNPDFIEVGKVAIAIALLYREISSNLRPDNNWYQLLFKRLNSPFEEFQNNKLSIITFNYDRSLEQYLFDVFKNNHYGKSEEEYKEKLNQLRILHVYGSLGRLDCQFDNPENNLPLVSYGNKLDPNRIHFAAKSIKIIPQKSSSPSKEFTEAQDLISKAKVLYFLGFGYNQDNMKRLGGIKTLQKPLKNMGTVKGLGHQEFQEIRRMNIFRKVSETYSGQTLQRQMVDNNIENFLFDTTVYEFLHGHVDFNSL
jgi:hypothetical protein